MRSGPIFIYGVEIEVPERGCHLERSESTVFLQGVTLPCAGWREAARFPAGRTGPTLEELRRAAANRTVWDVKQALANLGLEANEVVKRMGAFLARDSIVVDSVVLSGDHGLAVWYRGKNRAEYVQVNLGYNNRPKCDPASVAWQYCQFTELLSRNVMIIFPIEGDVFITSDVDLALRDIALARGLLVTECGRNDWAGALLPWNVARDFLQVPEVPKDGSLVLGHYGHRGEDP